MLRASHRTHPCRRLPICTYTRLLLWLCPSETVRCYGNVAQKRHLLVEAAVRQPQVAAIFGNTSAFIRASVLTFVTRAANPSLRVPTSGRMSELMLCSEIAGPSWRPILTTPASCQHRCRRLGVPISARPVARLSLMPATSVPTNELILMYKATNVELWSEPIPVSHYFNFLFLC